jgi:hypothetical protein
MTPDNPATRTAPTTMIWLDEPDPVVEPEVPLPEAAPPLAVAVLLDPVAVLQPIAVVRLRAVAAGQFFL